MANVHAVFIIALLLLSSEAFGKSVVEWYNMLPAERLIGGRFTLVQKRGVWTSTSPITEEEIEVVADIRNGYLYIADHGTGGGTIIHELALFTADGGKEYIGVNLKEFDGVGISSNLKFYACSDGRFRDVTADICPFLDTKEFIMERFKELSSAAVCLKQVSIDPQLPRKGTTLVLQLFTGRLEMMMTSEGMALKECAGLPDKLYKTIDLVWDVKKGVFRLGAKKR